MLILYYNEKCVKGVVLVIIHKHYQNMDYQKMDKMFSNVQITPSQGVSSPKEESKTENTEPQDTCESDLVNESNLFVTPLDNFEKETHIPIQPKTIPSSSDCKSNLKSNEIENNNSYGQHLVNFPVSEECGNTFCNNTSGVIACDNLVYTDIIPALSDCKHNFELNGIEVNNRYGRCVLNGSLTNNFNNNACTTIVPYCPIPPMMPNAIGIRNETSVYTNKVINTELIDMACNNANMDNSLLTDEITNEYSGAFKCISNFSKNTNSNPLVTFAIDQRKMDSSSSLTEEQSDMFKMRKLMSDVNLLLGLSSCEDITWPLYNSPNIAFPRTGCVLQSNVSNIDESLNTGEHHKNNKEFQETKSDPVNPCKIIIPYCSGFKYENIETNQEASSEIPLLYELPQIRSKPNELKDTITVTNVCNTNYPDIVNSSQKISLQSLVEPTSSAVGINKSYETPSTSAKQLDMIEDIMEQTVGQTSDLESASKLLNGNNGGGNDGNPYKQYYQNCNGQSNFNSVTTVFNINVNQVVNVNATSLPIVQNDVKGCKKRKIQFRNKPTTEFDELSWSDDEVLNKQIKLCMITLDENIARCENEDRLKSLTDEVGSKGDLDEMIERSINKYETFSADKSILATPSTIEKYSQTSSPLSDPRKNCKRCLFFNDESNKSKKMKYSDMSVNDSSQDVNALSENSPDDKTSEKNNMSPFSCFRKEITYNNTLSPQEVTTRFDESVSQFYITPSATVPALTEEESDECKSESEKTMFSDEDSESDENLKWSTESNPSSEFTKDQLVPCPWKKILLPLIPPGVPRMHETPKKPILRVGLSRRARPKPLHSPSPLH